jgi:hypothetical protein
MEDSRLETFLKEEGFHTLHLSIEKGSCNTQGSRDLPKACENEQNDVFQVNNAKHQHNKRVSKVL